MFFFFFFQFSDVATFGNHTQGDLAMFGYVPVMKVEIYSDPLLSLTTCLNNV